MNFLKSKLVFYFSFIATVEYVVSKDYVSNSLIPKPSQIIYLFIEKSKMLSDAFFQTASISFISFVLASLTGFLIGILIHKYPYLKKNLTPIALFFQTVPIIALAPLLIIYFGFGLPTIVSAAMIVCFFPVFSATLIGLEQVSQNQVELFQFLKANTWQKLFYLEIPSALPTILAGLTTSAGLSVVGVVSGEFMAGGGLGALIDSARLQQRVDIVFSALICLSIIGLFLMKLTEYTFKLLFKPYLYKN